MHGSWTTDVSMRTLRRVVALLVSLAAVAEHASGRSSAIRRAVLFFLVPAEALAWEFAAGLTSIPADRLAPVLRVDAGPEGAMRLALVFRALAAVLAAVLDDILATRQPAVVPPGRGGWEASGLQTALRRVAVAIERCDSS